jgi:predicted porin
VYSLSKRTGLYATAGKVKNGAKASFPLAAGDPLVSAGGPGAAPQGIAFGVRSAF